MHTTKTARLIMILFMLLLTLTACQPQAPDAYFKPLCDFVSQRGYSYAFAPLSDPSESIAVPIYNETVWYSLTLNGEELLVYFDASNRAKQLSEQFCGDAENGKVIYVGMRFIICYRGANEEIWSLMDDWQNQYSI